MSDEEIIQENLNEILELKSRVSSVITGVFQKCTFKIYQIF